MHRRSSHLLGAVVLALVASVLGVSAPAGAAPPLPGTPACEANAGRPGSDFPPPSAAAPAAGTYFSYPNRAAADQTVIRNRVINLINSTWGVYYTPTYSEKHDCVDGNGNLVAGYQYVTAWNRNTGSIRLATWSFNDYGVRDAIVSAVNRGTQVQVIAARGVNADKGYKPWFSTRDYLNSHRDTAGWGAMPGVTNLATECSGACRGAGGGTPHSKYYLFNDVDAPTPGYQHYGGVTVQTSMNLTQFAYQGQWNSANVFYDWNVYNRFAQVFNQSVFKEKHGYEVTNDSGVINGFYPGGSLNRDAAMNVLNNVRCTGTTLNRGRTQIRIIQYALYDTRGVMLAKKLRSLWNAGCDVKIIYSVTSKPVLQILRSGSGRGRVPMKQSVIKNRKGEIVKYNHSKWLSIAGFYRGYSTNAYTVLSGSSNWSNFAYSCDEAMQQTFGYAYTAGYVRTFDITWNQSSSRPPSYGGSLDGARVAARGASSHTFGYGQFKYMDND